MKKIKSTRRDGTRTRAQKTRAREYREARRIKYTLAYVEEGTAK